VQRLSLLLNSDDRDLFLARVSELNTTGVMEENDTLTAFFDDELDLSVLCDEYKGSLVESSNGSYDLGSYSTLESWDPILVGERFFVAPSWIHDQPPPGRYQLVVDAQSAFGSGRHESTQLMIKAMERVLVRGDIVLDVGCGSGILSAVAKALGGRTILACDTSFDAVRIAQQHNCGMPFFVGSADSVCAAAADLILVNISAAVCDLLAPDLGRILKPDGLLLLAGFIREKVPQSYTPRETLEQNGWLCWVCSHESIRRTFNRAPSIQPFAEQWW
jgi:ribosomal protein L11 methyltransferase